MFAMSLQQKQLPGSFVDWLLGPKGEFKVPLTRQLWSCVAAAAGERASPWQSAEQSAAALHVRAAHGTPPEGWVPACCLAIGGALGAGVRQEDVNALAPPIPGLQQHLDTAVHLRCLGWNKVPKGIIQCTSHDPGSMTRAPARPCRKAPHTHRPAVYPFGTADAWHGPTTVAGARLQERQAASQDAKLKMQRLLPAAIQWGQKDSCLHCDMPPSCSQSEAPVARAAHSCRQAVTVDAQQSGRSTAGSAILAVAGGRPSLQ